MQLPPRTCYYSEHLTRVCGLCVCVGRVSGGEIRGHVCVCVCVSGVQHRGSRVRGGVLRCVCVFVAGDVRHRGEEKTRFFFCTLEFRVCNIHSWFASTVFCFLFCVRGFFPPNKKS